MYISHKCTVMQFDICNIVIKNYIKVTFNTNMIKTTQT